jgi:hypothetical protein
MDANTLSSYPYVRVRLACTKCPPRGSYRLARLAEKYGADVRMTDLLEQLAGDCKWRRPRHPFQEGCGAFFEDLKPPPRPPDLPPALSRFRVVSGSRK